MSAIDDSSSEIVYNLGDAWEPVTNAGSYGAWGGTAHRATQANAKASLTFMGRSISATCLLWPTGSNVTATLDGNLIGTYNTAAADITAAGPRILFTKDNLDETTQHTLVLEKMANDPGWLHKKLS